MIEEVVRGNTSLMMLLSQSGTLRTLSRWHLQSEVYKHAYTLSYTYIHSHTHKYTNTYLRTHKHCLYYGYVRGGLVKTMNMIRRYFSWNTNVFGPFKRERQSEWKRRREFSLSYPTSQQKLKKTTTTINLEFAGPIHFNLGICRCWHQL